MSQKTFWINGGRPEPGHMTYYRSKNGQQHATTVKDDINMFKNQKVKSKMNKVQFDNENSSNSSKPQKNIEVISNE